MEKFKFNLSFEEEKEAFKKALGKGAREEALERKPDGFERKNKIHKDKKKYQRHPKHKKTKL